MNNNAVDSKDLAIMQTIQVNLSNNRILFKYQQSEYSQRIKLLLIWKENKYHFVKLSIKFCDLSNTIQ